MSSEVHRKPRAQLAAKIRFEFGIPLFLVGTFEEHREAERKRTEFSKDCSRIEASLVNGTSVEQLCSVLLLQSPSPATPQKERICYSSEFLKRFANLPIAKTKPKYLPDISIVLQESREYRD
ncbi:uncharacterized protein C8orf88 homolog isoform X3 [Lepisosteus oculatus]|uniref:uncharacterized protein C8orf88 homolog isoform X3 n=1 Tax=Lepisosteus oculatus TaxID=7918 RepID=UPI0035F50183